MECRNRYVIPAVLKRSAKMLNSATHNFFCFGKYNSFHKDIIYVNI